LSPTSDTRTYRDLDDGRRPPRLCGLTIVLPCFNEAENLPDAVQLATVAAERWALKHEIVIVDDGSTDDTAAEATELIVRDPRIRLVVHVENRGYGPALRSGIAAARLPWVLLIDADLQFDFGELEDFLPLTPSADLVVGWRILPQGPVGRRAGGALWNRFLRAALHLPERDVDCAFRLVRRELLDRLDLRATGALVGAELLVKSRAAGARVAEVPVHHRPRIAGRQAGGGRRLGTRTLRELADLRRTPRGGPPRPLGV
jgi:glycosyltransferase involved in cell wall biosynthesis